MNPLSWLEADMARHMLLEFPLLIALGAAIAHRLPVEVDARIARIDAYGLSGWTLASLVVAFWMIPAALDAALGNAAVNAAKCASLVATGFALRSALRRSPVMLEAFFVGNFAWMTATVGLIYQDAKPRLCLNYLTDSQQSAGRGLVLATLAVFVLWFALRARAAVLSVGPGAGDSHRATPRAELT